MKISAALIVKNEENTLAQCLRSIQGSVDEIIIVDTGSEDKTKEIARQFTSRVHDFAWRNDFAAARQFSFGLATGDWVMWLDADDEVINAERIRSSVAGAPSNVRGFYWRYIVGHDAYGNPTCELWRERCVRNDRSFYWSGKVHEVLTSRQPATMVRNSEVTVVHRPDANRRNSNPYRNLQILQEQYAAALRNPEPRLLLCLGNEYVDLGHLESALEFLQRYVQVSTWDEQKYLAQVRIADIYRLQQRYLEAIAADFEALKIYPQWPNAYLSLGETYYFLKDWPKVIHWIESGQRLPAPETLCTINPAALKFKWIIYYTNALYRVGRLHEALEWTQKALQICPDDVWHTMNWHFFAEALRQQTASHASANGNALPALFWHAPVFDPSGYAEEARQFVLGLDSIGLRVRLIPQFFWTGVRADLPTQEIEHLRRLITVQVEPSEHVVSVFHMTANNFYRIPAAAYHVGRTMCETDRIPREWVPACNQMDEIWVPCQFNVETFARSGVMREKLVRMPGAIDVDRYRPDAPPLPIDGRRGFNFLSIFEWSRRKGWDVLLRAFVEEFRADENVALILKIGAMSQFEAEQYRQQAISELHLAGITSNLPPNVVLYHANLPAEHLPSLYRAADIFVLPSRGEGWGRPFMEAMAMGLPAIGTRWSGQLDFMNDENSYLIDCHVVDVPEVGWKEAGIFRGHRWAEPSIEHLRRLMRLTFEDRQAACRKGEAAREHVAANFSRQAIARLIQAHLLAVCQHF